MSSSHRSRNVILALIAILILLILSFLLIRSCVQNRREAARDLLDDVRTTRQTQSGSNAGSQSSAGASGSQGQQSGGQDGQLAPPQAPPEDEGNGGIVVVDDHGAGIEIVDQSVTPFTSVPGHDMAFVVDIRGEAASVTMSVVDTSGAGGAFTVSLSSWGQQGDLTVWNHQGTSPSFPGTYSFSTTATSADGRSVTVAGGTFVVEEQ